MSDPLQDVGKGQPVRSILDRRRVNAWNAAARYVSRQKDSGATRTGYGEEKLRLCLPVKNKTDGSLPVYSCLTVRDLLHTEPVADRDAPLFEADAPTQEYPDLVITQEPLAPDAVGPAVMTGGTFVSIDVVSEGDGYAAALSDTTTHLQSSTAGPARILWRDPAGPGTDGRTRCYVWLGASSPAAEGFWARLTGKESAPGCYTAYSWVQVVPDDGTGGPDCPITWLDTDARGGPGGTASTEELLPPAYEVNNTDLPVSGEDSTDGTDPPLPFVVWLRPAPAGDYYLINVQPRWEFVEPTGAGTGGLVPGQMLRWDEAGQQAVFAEDVLIIDLNAGD